MDEMKIDDKAIEETAVEGAPDTDEPMSNPENLDEFEDGEL